MNCNSKSILLILNNLIMKKRSLDDFKSKMNRKEMRSTKGGLLGILCIEGVLDGIKGNTRVYFGKCRPYKN